MANAHSSEQVWLLFVEVSDQTGKIKLAGVFTTKELAREADERFATKRTIIEAWALNTIDGGEHGLRLGEVIKHSVKRADVP